MIIANYKEITYDEYSYPEWAVGRFLSEILSKVISDWDIN